MPCSSRICDALNGVNYSKTFLHSTQNNAITDALWLYTVCTSKCQTK